MRWFAAPAVLALASCATTQPPTTATATPVDPAKLIEAAGPSLWKAIPADDLLLVDLADGRRVTIQLAPRFAPVHVANVKALARGKWWDGANIYRVHENYVVQWGRNESTDPFPAGVVAKPPAEYDFPVADRDVVRLGWPDAYAPVAGFVDGWPVGYDPKAKTGWLTHCYGTVAIGRDLPPDTGTGGELYAVVGHSPRHLDRNLAVIGRVIDGFEAMSSLPRGTGDLGFYTDKKMNVPIKRTLLASSLPLDQQPRWERIDTDQPTWTDYVRARANRSGGFWARPAGAIDLCNAKVLVRPVKA